MCFFRKISRTQPEDKLKRTLTDAPAHHLVLREW
jgi:hypothetical protein